MRLIRATVVAAVWLAFLCPSHAQTQVEYIGGTNPAISEGSSGRIELTDDHYFAFYAKKAQVRVPYDRVNLIEYGQQVDRRILAALVISPVFLLSKARKHYLTIGYSDDHGTQQVMVMRVDKNSIRSALVIMEARTGRKIAYQDTEARKAGN